MESPYQQRLRITFGKIGPTRWIGHLDVARTWERALNRAKIPVGYTQGFNRRPKMQFANPLPLGFTSDCEYVDLWLVTAITPEIAKAQLQAKMPPDLPVHAVVEVPMAQAALPLLTREAMFRAEIAHVEVDSEQLAQQVANFIASDAVLSERSTGKQKGVSYDLRPLVIDLALDLSAPLPVVIMNLWAKEEKNGRADAVLSTLGVDPLAVRIHRTHLLLDTAS